ncbi:MAG TPA: ATP-binding protein [Bacteroidia bacterium]|nr:ATP-binding protein [Bacteroidia bacterium]
MEKSKQYSRALLIFYILVIYVLVQFIWWAYHMAQQSQEILNLQEKINELQSNGMCQTDNLADLHKKLTAKYFMIFGEGSVFLLIMLVGIAQVRKAFKKESELLARQRTFLHSVTHEFKSPIASLKLQIETLLKRNLSNEQQQQALSNALEDTERLDQLLEKILISARIDNGELPFYPEKIDLSEKLKDSLNKLLRAYQHRDIVEHIQDKVEIHMDPWAFSSIVTNLVENALIYSPKEKPVIVELKKEGNKILLLVKDHGPGIPVEERKKIFQKFYRMSTSSGYKGTGLGLYLVDYIIKRHNGSITVKENSPNGTIFEVALETE